MGRLAQRLFLFHRLKISIFTHFSVITVSNTNTTDVSGQRTQEGSVSHAGRCSERKKRFLITASAGTAGKQITGQEDD